MLNPTLALIAVALATSASVFAAPKSYQVTGPVLDMNDKTITVQKGKEKWEISRDASTKVSGDLKVGSKVTVQYHMAADEIETKAEKSKKK